MTDRNGPDVSGPIPSTPSEGVDASQRHRRRRWRSRVTVLTIGGLAVAPLVYSSSSLSSPGSVAAPATGIRLAALAVPPAGMSWIQGTLTDQAGHRLNNVNVEAWSTGRAPGGPLASSLSYAGPTASNLSYAGRGQRNGVFRLEVPARTAYKVTFSTINGREDGDRFRMRAYGGGRPIMARTAARVSAAAAAVVAAPGRVIDLGTIELARQGHVASTTTVRLLKKRVKAGRRARARITLRSPYVSVVTGPVRIRVGKKTRIRHLERLDGGTLVVRLPRTKPGKRLVRVRFRGSSTVAASRAHPVRLIVKKRKH